LKEVYKLILTFVILLLTSAIVMHSIVIDIGSEVGYRLVRSWYEEVGSSNIDINSSIAVVHQSLALTLFLFVIAVTVFRMEWRVAAAFFSLTMIVILGVTPPQNLIKYGVEWDLILFLIGSMTLAGVLRELGVFEYLAVNVVRISKGNSILLLSLILLLAFTLAAILGEVTSIIYVIMLLFELSRLLKLDIKPLIILSVLATNTGSTALPVGNPIGIYLFFTANMSMGEFLRNAFILSLIALTVFLMLVIKLEKGMIMDISKAFSKSLESIDTFITSYYIRISEKRRLIRSGLIILIAFIVTVILNEYISTYLTLISGFEVDPHSLLSFIPYIFLIISLAIVPPEEVPVLITKSVEWPSILFFISLFLLSYSLVYTGVMVKIAYVLSSIRYPLLVLATFLLTSALLSSVLDNLSVIVSLTPIATLLNNLGLIGRKIYFALLFGGVFGGNYTPIGSTANIVALSMVESRGIKTSWGEWLKISLISTTMQIVVSLIWLYLI